MDPAEAEAIRQHLANLQRQPWLGSHRWWPGYAFHLTSLDNAVHILEDGRLRSRAQLEQDGVGFHDCANPQIIAGTDTRHTEYVRLHWRPRTPFQYNIEGIRSAAQVHPSGAAMPLPVCMLFGLSELLISDGCRFSDTSLGSPTVQIGSGIRWLEQLDFRKIYHDTWRSRDATGDSIKRARNAEILAADELPLGLLKHVICRSSAERTTLLAKLSPTVRARIQSIVQLWPQRAIFERKWVFVNSVERTTVDRLRIDISGSRISPGPYRIGVDLSANGQLFSSHVVEKNLNERCILVARTPGVPGPIQISVMVDDHLAFDAELEFVTLV